MVPEDVKYRIEWLLSGNSPGQWEVRINKEKSSVLCLTQKQDTLPCLPYPLQSSVSHYSLTSFKIMGYLCSALTFENRSFLTSTHYSLSVHINQRHCIANTISHSDWGVPIFPMTMDSVLIMFKISYRAWAVFFQLHLNYCDVLTGCPLSFNIRPHFMVSENNYFSV